MLPFDYLNVLTAPIVQLYERYEQTVINDIVRRLVKTGRITATAAWQIQRLSESGAVYENIIKQLAITTGKSRRELKKLFKAAGVKSVKFGDSIYRKAGLKPLPLNLSPAMTEVLAAGLRKTEGTLFNLISTTATSGQNLFIEAADMAYMQVVTGAFDYDTAIRQAVKHIARQGLSVIQFPKRRHRLDTSVRRAVLTGVGQTAGRLAWARCEEMGVDLVQTSAHIGARNEGTGPMNHESWQGRIFSRRGTDKKYPDFITVTGFGTGEGLHGWNCRHSFYPYFKGLSESAYKKEELRNYADKTVTYKGKEMSFYEATQKQREIERAIRRAKREVSALDAAGLDKTQEHMKVRRLQARMRDFIKQTGLNRQGSRERVL